MAQESDRHAPEDLGVILCWNRDDPDTWPVDEYQEFRSWVTDEGPQEGGWSVGRRKNIQPGVHALLLAQGQKHPRGLVGHGIICAPPSPDEHWKDPASITNYVRVIWDNLLPWEEPIPIDELVACAPQLPWRTGIQGSGFPVAPGALSALLDLWTHFDPALEEAGPGELSAKEYREGAVRTVMVNRYERDPQARQACLDHHGYTCQACMADLTTVYGQELGQRAIHVHHVIPMATRGKEYRLDPVRDLVPLCPNCHNVIHKTNPVMTPAHFRETILRHP